MRRTLSVWISFLTLVLLAACGTGDQALDVAEIDTAALADARPYIVVLHGEANADLAPSNRARAAEVARAYGLTANRTYGAALVGFAAHVPAGRLAALQRDPRVDYVETDDPVTLFAQTVPTGIDRIFATDNASIDIDGNDDLRVDVDVAVIDTGIDFEHPDLNVVGGVDCTVGSGGGPPWAKTYTCSASHGTGGDDDHYHGTHVAGTIAALDNGEGVVGVAPGARLWAVKVLDSSGSGYESGIVAGIDWIAGQGVIEVANMSLGGSGYSQAEYDAITSAVASGVAFAVAAGNSDADASGFSPAAFDNVLTVSALADFDGVAGALGSSTCRTDQDDTLADFSNWGPAVDIAAPGVCILSTYPLEQGGYGTISGTSMASPHVAGALALYASAGLAGDVPALYEAVLGASNLDWTDDSGDGIKEPLLDVSSFPTTTGGGDGDTTNTAPEVTISSPAADATFIEGDSITFTGTANDTQDGDLTENLTWTSDLAGKIGVGGTFSTTLSTGTHVVTATVVDSGDLTGTADVTIIVKAADGGGETSGPVLSAVGYKVKGVQFADLTWTGASGDVDVKRDGAMRDTVSGTTYTDAIGNKGGGSYTYEVCETAIPDACSAPVIVTF